jgi:hypothetical protein
MVPHIRRIDLLGQLLDKLFLLIELFLGNRGHVEEATDIDFVGHELRVALSQRLDCLDELIVDADLIFQSFAVSIIERSDLRCLVLEISVRLQCSLGSFGDQLLLFSYLLNLSVLVFKLSGKHTDSSLELSDLQLIELLLSNLANIVELLLPLLLQVVYLLLKHLCLLIGLINVLCRDCGVKTFCVLLCLQNHLTFSVHELVHAFVLL